MYTNLYLLPMIVAVVVIFANMIFSQKMKYDRKFTSIFSNRLYALSFLKPFVWFINPDENDPRVKQQEEDIKKAGVDHLINYRSFTTFQALLFLGLMVVYVILFLFMEPIVHLLNFVFRINGGDIHGDTTQTKLLIGIILGIAIIVPKFYIKSKVKSNEFAFSQELPIVQLSIILMLRAKRPLMDILYSMGCNETRYRRIFEKTYRIYLRDKSDAWKYLKKEFKGTGFEDTVDVLESMDNFSKEETIRVLENGLEFFIQDSVNQKKKGAALGNLFSQFSMAIPFGGVLLLGACPFTIYMFKMISTQNLF